MIPIITDPLGKYWEQPDLNKILVDNTHAAMSETTMKQLKEYSSSIPSGVYNGKMWRRVQQGTNYLCWFGDSNQPNMCRINMREIILID